MPQVVLSALTRLVRYVSSIVNALDCRDEDRLMSLLVGCIPRAVDKPPLSESSLRSNATSDEWSRGRDARTDIASGRSISQKVVGDSNSREW